MNALSGAQNLPLSALRMKVHRLARDSLYVAYCDTGERSAAAAFLLAQHGFDARYLAKGIGMSGMNSPGLGCFDIRISERGAEGFGRSSGRGNTFECPGGSCRDIATLGCLGASSQSLVGVPGRGGTPGS